MASRWSARSAWRRRAPRSPCAYSACRASARISCCAPSRSMGMPFSRIEDALADLAEGRFVIIAEGESGESQLCMAAELTTPDAVNFMAMHGRGLVCLSMTEERLRQLGIPLMAPDAPSVVRRSYGASIEARRGVTTGISAHDRAAGVVVRAGLTEAAVDLIRLAGRQPAAAVCAILTDDGNLATADDLEALAELFELKIVRVPDLVAYRLRTESLVHRVAERSLTIRTGG